MSFLPSDKLMLIEMETGFTEAHSYRGAPTHPAAGGRKPYPLLRLRGISATSLRAAKVRTLHVAPLKLNAFSPSFNCALLISRKKINPLPAIAK